MEIIVAGAGAGKTTKMASKVIAYAENTPSDKIIYCLAFTNNAVERIKKMLLGYYGRLPENIHVQTIHSFLIQEFISPYYYIMFGIHYDKFTCIELSDNNIYRNRKISELEKKRILHVSTVPQRAKWIVSKKTGDKKKQKQIRDNALVAFSEYCAGIFIDEAQDIDDDMAEILCVFNKRNIPLFLMGDPKQDVKGHGSFRNLIQTIPDIKYISECHRCPEKHIRLSNSIVGDKEAQIPQKPNGTIEICYEEEFCDYSTYGLVYISKKNNRYDTHMDCNTLNKRFETLEYELFQFFGEKHPKKEQSLIHCMSYYYAELMISDVDNNKTPKDVIKKHLNIYGNLGRETFAKIAQALQFPDMGTSNSIPVNSIESIKGQEAERCLFILTTDLAPYLFGEKREENKMKNLLYVGLTRSLSHLTILITNEVEKKYTKAFIDDYFSKYKV